MRSTGAQHPGHHRGCMLAPAGRRHFPAPQQSPSESDDEHFEMRSTAEVHQLLWAPAQRLDQDWPVYQCLSGDLGAPIRLFSP